MKEKILVVDDERDIVNLVGYHLNRAGIEVIPAYSGAEALEKAGMGGPDLIVLDLMMPELDGFEVCRILRRRGEAAIKDIPIVMLTARAEVEEKIKGLSLSADDYVTKPFEPKELIARIENLLSKKRAKEAIENRVKTLEARLYKPGGLKAASAYYHSLDGRLRIKAPGIKGHREKAAEIEQRMACIKGIIKVEASPVTGSILIYFDPAHANADSIERHLISLDIFEIPSIHAHKGESIGQAVGKTAIQTLLERLILAAI